jgi:hypothetical protein
MANVLIRYVGARARSLAAGGKEIADVSPMGQCLSWPVLMQGKPRWSLPAGGHRLRKG